LSFLPPFQHNRLLKDFSTFNIGGPARFFVQVTEVPVMRELLTYCHQETLPFIILGKGSNCLFHDLGFDGLVIHNKIAYLSIKEQEIDVGAGYSFSLLGVQTAKRGLAGLEFASGIPASVGGAIFMNAGASGAETATCLQEVTFITEKGEIEVLQKKDLQFAYRFSSFQEKKGAIVSARFKLEPDEKARDRQRAIVEYRTKTQPYEDPSVGCIFKNPQDRSAGMLIDQYGLKGLRVGGAEVSKKHANFLVNRDQATAEDVLLLSRMIREKIKQETGLELEMEVRCIPYRPL